MDNKQLGSYGEEIAAKFLLDKGYLIIDRNFKCKIGEIDIIAKDKNYIIFVEVKTRRSNQYGTPGEAVNNKKQSKIIAVANYFIKNKSMTKLNLDYRFDVVEIYLDDNINYKRINLIKNAFDE